MNKEKAMSVIEDLAQYAYENWDGIEYEDELNDIEKAINVLKPIILSSKVCGMLEINGQRYLVQEE